MCFGLRQEANGVLYINYADLFGTLFRGELAHVKG